MEKLDPPDPHLSYVFSTCLDQPVAVNAKVTGSFPTWLNGSLVGIGPGVYEIAGHAYNHYSDGMSMLTRFSIKEGRVTYRSKYLQSQTYTSNIENGRITFDEGGTVASPDPKQNVFSRFASKLKIKPPSDNCNVNIWHCYTGECFAVAENKFVIAIDPDTLDTSYKMDLSEIMEDAFLVSAHLQTDSEGVQYGLAQTVGGGGPKLMLFKVPEPMIEGGSDSILSSIEVLSKLKGRFNISPCFVHSIGLSANYVVIIENPFFVNVLKLVRKTLVSKPVLEAFDFDVDEQTKIHVCRKDTGEKLVTQYVTDPIATFHHINCYEEGHHVIVDVFVIKDPIKVLHSASLKSLRSCGGCDTAEAHRFVLPLQSPLNTDVFNEKVIVEEDKTRVITEVNKTPLVKIKGHKATAQFQQDGHVYCTSEKLTEPGFEKPHLPRSMNGLKNEYFYAIGGYSSQSDVKGSICKVCTKSKCTTLWRAGTNEYPQEAVYVPKPESQCEDEGVLLASVVVASADIPNYMVILDAQTMTEVARATLPLGVGIPALNHEIFIEKVAK